MEHRYIIGQSGTGKTSLLYELFTEDTTNGVCFIDTKGDLEIPHDILFDPEFTLWNPLDEPVDRNFSPQFFAQAVKDAYGYDDLTTPVMNMYLSFLASAIQENHRNITNIPDFLTDKSFRGTYSYTNKLTKQFWENYETLSEKDKRHEISSTLNKFLTLLLDGRINRMFSVNHTKLSLKDVSDKVMLVRIPVSLYGKETVALIGSLILSYINQLIDTDYSIYIEDVNLFAKGVLIDMFSNSRIGLTVSHQYVDQLHPTLFAAIQGNCSKQYLFRVSRSDCDVLSDDLPPNSSRPTLAELTNFHYRTIPYNKYLPDKQTVPLEK